MAGLWAEDFYRYPSTANMLLGAWAQIDAGWALSSANPPRPGGKHMRLTTGDGGDQLVRRTLVAAKTTAGLATRFYCSALPTCELETPNNSAHYCGIVLRMWRDPVNGTQVVLALGTDGALQAYSGDQGAGGSAGWTAAKIGVRSAQCFYPQTYHHIEDKIHVDGSTGTYEVRVDGVTRINVSGVNTNPTGQASVSQVALGYHGGDVGVGVGGILVDLADTHAWDTDAGNPGPTDFVGNAGCLNRQLTADTATADFALSTGATGYTLLKDASTTTYISSGTVNDKSAFSLAALDANVTGIVYQQPNYFAEKTDVSDCNITPGFKGSGAEEGYGAESIMNAGWAWKWAIVDQDPHTGAAWTAAGANGASVLFKRTL